MTPLDRPVWGPPLLCSHPFVTICLDVTGKMAVFAPPLTHENENLKTNTNTKQDPDIF
jgi:hypothetical protein